MKVPETSYILIYSYFGGDSFIFYFLHRMAKETILGNLKRGEKNLPKEKLSSDGPIMTLTLIDI